MGDMNSLHNRAVWFDIPVANPVILDSEGNRIALHSTSDA